ncbi:hypothetical protein A8C56_02065 [Niabella ginsenosidivorans]|uniref:Uncharacterized protein n=1 Tax=Niabella ginsenosidivorans TaxID=1176587 RepID=A0A1A9HZN4_9BACT|nr:hypothetical protein [Niabella ginsenosidivorans]ANH79921.1 hypothetical protein A8C56_02065 [Niabella ginsenosidivorans]
MTKDDATQIMLFHDYLYGTHKNSIQAQSRLVRDFGFKPDRFPVCRPGILSDGTLRPDTSRVYTFREVSGNTYAHLNSLDLRTQGKRLTVPQSSYSVTGSDMRAARDNTYYRNNSVAGNYFSKNWIPLSGIGMAATGTATEAYLTIKDYETFKTVVKEGKFIANWNGKRVWKTGFKGNAAVAADAVAVEKAAFNATFKTMKLVKVAGHLTAAGGVVLSVADAANKGFTAEANGKLALDVIMTGVAFIPGPGWIISGLYFLTDGVLTLSGNDWWHEVWQNFILPTAKSIEDAADSYYKARRIMYVP